MPTLAQVGPYRFFFYSNEGNEPAHVHVERGHNVAKFWLGGPVLASSRGFSAQELRRIAQIVADRQSKFQEAWNEYFSR